MPTIDKPTVPANDFLGHPIEVGHTVVYPVRRGSKMWMQRSVSFLATSLIGVSIALWITAASKMSAGQKVSSLPTLQLRMRGHHSTLRTMLLGPDLASTSLAPDASR